MANGQFIQVILPLRLEWEPYYELEGAAVGERVKVEFAHKEYIGVVSSVGVTPEVEKILPAAKTDLPPISPQEIAFWKQVAAYYLCTPGEVYKAAYPSVLRQGKPRKVPAGGHALADGTPLPPSLDNALSAILEGFARQKTILLQGSSLELQLELARRTLSGGRSVLMLVPEIALTRPLEESIKARFPDLLCYHSEQTMGTRRSVAAGIREQKASFVLGTRSALFLPHHNIGLVIVDQEHDASFKQDSPAPRYHARETAIMLASVHGAHVLLSSTTPSLESLYNAETGLFTRVQLSQNLSTRVQLVNTAAEARKKGMSGSFSFKLIEGMRTAIGRGEKVLLVCRAKAALQECEEEVRGLFPEGTTQLATPATAKLTGPFPLIAVLQADGLLGKEDFRADEKALQLLQLLQGRCQELFIQTREDKHPVFKALMEGGDGLSFLPERRVVGYPPLSRLIHINLRDKSAKRIEYMGALLSRELSAFLPTVIGPFTPSQADNSEDQLRCIRLLLPRDRHLIERKKALLAVVSSFEKARKYQGHIAIDVDPA